MHRLIFYCLLFCSLGAAAQPFDTLRRKDAGAWEFLQVRGNGTIINEGNRHNGINEGVWTSYWDNGFPHYIVTFKAGVKDGLSLETDHEGFTILMENYRNGHLEGPRRVYTRGAFIAEEAYYSGGVKSGSFTKWYTNGRKQEESNYNNNERDGKSTWYYENGQKAAEYNYDRGRIDGDVTLYDNLGKVAEFGAYKEDVQTGLWKEYYPNGKEKAEGQYAGGEKSGIWKRWDDSGKPLPAEVFKTRKSSKN